MLLCMNRNIENAVILGFYDFHLRGQTKVVYTKICLNQYFFICIPGTIL